MSQRAKLIADICNNPRDVRFEDACKIAGWLGFVSDKNSGGSHRAYSRPGEPTGLNFQNRGGKIVPYQARQLIEMIERYGHEIGID
ncbi:hypothetical protein JQ581_02480 [Bradyrhizobium liaoningense]|uniref:hypothetical protein n=1 Tax=Bradyrhizobium liaoningense TaxID=43992 RepID=UPI001BA730EA|nr:hypothetical protein [Bradyrhizobium liaoningense]MBR0735781.1 hypothetical protein [Bradyrhizobium liaoningense]